MGEAHRGPCGHRLRPPNPYRLRDSAARLERALAHPLLHGVDLVVGLGDLAHFGDAESLATVIEIVAARGVPAVLVSGNHDVLEEGVRLEDIVEKIGAPGVATPIGGVPAQVAAVLDHFGPGVLAHEITGTWPEPTRPFAVVARCLAEARSEAPQGPPAHLVITHFPVLSTRDRARAAGLLYSGHLADLADAGGLGLPPGPALVLSGHLHLRAVASERDVLQIVFAALVEDPYDVACLDIRGGAGQGPLTVSYECASVHPSGAATVPVLDPPRGSWSHGRTGWERA